MVSLRCSPTGEVRPGAPPPGPTLAHGPRHAIDGDIGSQMAEYGEWNRKGATLSDVTAQKEYGVTRDFIVEGIRAGKLEYRDGAVWGNPYLRVLRSQLELYIAEQPGLYIAEQPGKEHFLRKKAQTDLRAVSKEIADIKKKLAELERYPNELNRLGDSRIR